jgi:hypothetical protein
MSILARMHDVGSGKWSASLDDYKELADAVAQYTDVLDHMTLRDWAMTNITERFLAGRGGMEPYYTIDMSLFIENVRETYNQIV